MHISRGVVIVLLVIVLLIVLGYCGYVHVNVTNK
jgi:hypothetical protein